MFGFRNYKNKYIPSHLRRFLHHRVGISCTCAAVGQRQVVHLGSGCCSVSQPLLARPQKTLTQSNKSRKIADHQGRNTSEPAPTFSSTENKKYMYLVGKKKALMKF